MCVCVCVCVCVCGQVTSLSRAVVEPSQRLAAAPNSTALSQALTDVITYIQVSKPLTDALAQTLATHMKENTQGTAVAIALHCMSMMWHTSNSILRGTISVMPSMLGARARACVCVCPHRLVHRTRHPSTNRHQRISAPCPRHGRHNDQRQLVVRAHSLKHQQQRACADAAGLRGQSSPAAGLG